MLTALSGTGVTTRTANAGTILPLEQDRRIIVAVLSLLRHGSIYATPLATKSPIQPSCDSAQTPIIPTPMAICCRTGLSTELASTRTAPALLMQTPTEMV